MPIDMSLSRRCMPSLCLPCSSFLRWLSRRKRKFHIDMIMFATKALWTWGLTAATAFICFLEASSALAQGTAEGIMAPPSMQGSNLGRRNAREEIPDFITNPRLATGASVRNHQVVGTRAVEDSAVTQPELGGPTDADERKFRFKRTVDDEL
ncbi:uncharacterized protein EV422DRAFT_523153 [Fimicolochytrium jonesii]|uniref:uncharacterized protein n=1 Tax=Fimicolochytrium jonesii TaxID=1396493 RepID=UPI0022FE4281|nr:uncharacterized protein EV422DRAFT_523153 [Fimicolochytrium jonesii]KAI8823045.1 hypothetical protein EV422DRAFT_523153 [Fimicolochytrium jonesii]